MECGICFEQFPSDVIKFMPCAHYLCSFCYNALKKQECPYCRISFENSENSDDEVYFQMIPYEEERKKKKKKKKKNRRNNETESFTFSLRRNSFGVLQDIPPGS